MTAAHQLWHDSAWFATWLRIARHVAILLACVWSVSGASYYASTTGSALNPGTLASPWSIQYALTNATVAAGDTIYLRGGTYTNTYLLSNISGSSTNTLITVKSYAPEWAKLRAWIQVYGSNVVFRDFEIAGADTNRTSALSDPWSDIVTSRGIDVYVPGVKLINLVIHDKNGDGVGSWSGAEGNEVYGCVIYYNGFQAPDRGHGHGLYIQNIGSSGYRKVFQDNLVFSQLDVNAQAYGTGAAYVNDITLLGNALYNAGQLSALGNAIELVVTGGTAMTNITVSTNVAYKSDTLAATPIIFGYENVPMRNFQVIGNHFEQMFYASWLTNSGTVTGNSFFLMPNVYMVKLQVPDLLPPPFAWDANNYYANYATPFQLSTNLVTPGSPLSFADWKADTGYDASSTYSTANPVLPMVLVRPNKYESGRANVIVRNYALANNVSVDLSSVCTTGAVYTVRNAADYFGPTVKTFTYTGSTVSLPMTNLTVATPVGFSPKPATGPAFNAFVIVPNQGKTVMQAPTVRAGKVRRK